MVPAEARIQDGPQRQQFAESSPSLSKDTGEGIRTIKTKGRTLINKGQKGMKTLVTCGNGRLVAS